MRYRKPLWKSSTMKEGQNQNQEAYRGCAASGQIRMPLLPRGSRILDHVALAVGDIMGYPRSIENAAELYHGGLKPVMQDHGHAKKPMRSRTLGAAPDGDSRVNRLRIGEELMPFDPGGAMSGA